MTASTRRAQCQMAIYHFSAKAVKRAAGRSSVAAAAYRSGERLVDDRTGMVHDYSRRTGVLHSVMLSPHPFMPTNREALWNAVEASERRRDACVAREYVVALPAEITSEQRKVLVEGFAKYLAKYRGCLVDAAIHAPSKSGDQRNYHAHLLCSTRQFLQDGTFGAKVITERAGQNRKADLKHLRNVWEKAVNWSLERASINARVDARSYTDQGIRTIATPHLGPAATAIERQDRLPSKNRLRWKEATAQKVRSLVSQCITESSSVSKSHQELAQQKERGHSYDR